MLGTQTAHGGCVKSPPSAAHGNSFTGQPRTRMGQRLKADEVMPKTESGVNAPWREAGFTLLELLIVLGILAAAAVFAMPLATRPHSDATLTATAYKLANGMRMARASAIRDNRERTLTIDLARRRFWVDGVTAAAPISEGIAVDLVTVRAEQLSARQGRLRFFVDGSSTGGNVRLSGGGRTVSVKLDWMTGHASVSRGR